MSNRQRLRFKYYLRDGKWKNKAWVIAYCRKVYLESLNK